MRCPYCHGRLGALDVVRCERCDTPVHAECAALHGRCVTFGCGSPNLAPARAHPARAAGLRYRPPLSRRAGQASREAWGALDRVAQGPALIAAALLGLATLGGLCLVEPPRPSRPPSAVISSRIR